MQFGLSMINHITGKNISLPILNNVLIKTENKNIRFSTTNLEIGITSLIRGKVEKEGEFTVDAKLISDYVNFLPKEKVDLELKDQKLDIRCENFNTILNGQEANEFPLIPKIDKKNNFSVKISDFKEAIQQTNFSVSSSETRPEISGVYLKASGSKLIVAATDSYRLAEKVVTLAKAVDADYEAIIPSRTLQELSRILANFQSKKEADENPVENLEIYFSENQILFSLNEVEIISRVIEGQFPDYQQIIPGSHNTRLTLSTANLAQATKAASLFTKSGINDISMMIEAGKLTIFSQNVQAGENTIKVEADIEGGDNKIILNHRYLLDGINVLNSDEMILDITDNNTPCLLYPKNQSSEKPDYRYLIMPIRQ